MSTYFDGLNRLFSSVKVRKEGKHTKVDLFINNQNAGTVTLSDDGEARRFLEVIFNVDEVLHRTTQGISINYAGWPDDAQVLSEYGEITTYNALINDELNSFNQ